MCMLSLCKTWCRETVAILWVSVDSLWHIAAMMEIGTWCTDDFQHTIQLFPSSAATLPPSSLALWLWCVVTECCKLEALICCFWLHCVYCYFWFEVLHALIGFIWNARAVSCRLQPSIPRRLPSLPWHSWGPTTTPRVPHSLSSSPGPARWVQLTRAFAGFACSVKCCIQLNCFLHESLTKQNNLFSDLTYKNCFFKGDIIMSSWEKCKSPCTAANALDFRFIDVKFNKN